VTNTCLAGNLKTLHQLKLPVKGQADSDGLGKVHAIQNHVLTFLCSLNVRFVVHTAMTLGSL